MNRFLFLFLTLLIPTFIGIIGWMDNTQEVSYPFILGFIICLALYFPATKKVKDGT